MNKPRLVIVGAGLSGSVLAARLRNHFAVTVIEQSATRRPLYHDIECAEGGVTTTINRAAGLGGTTNYWHNALIELAADELRDGGIDPVAFAPHYQQAWSLFLTDAQRAQCETIRAANASAVVGGGTAHMVVPQARVNLWHLANARWTGDPIDVRYGTAKRLAREANGRISSVQVESANGTEHVEADHFIVAGGGLSTPALLADSFRGGDAMCGGYHDHPMAYVAKVRLRPGSTLKQVSCVETGPASVRAGFVYESRGLKAVFYLRPALNLNPASIQGEARYILSDLRNDPFSPRKILQLLGNIEALREAVLFKTRAGFLGDYYSVLMLGEQAQRDDRGLRCTPGNKPRLNWHVAADEDAAYRECFDAFLADIAGDMVDHRAIPAAEWEYRTAAHHSGTAHAFSGAASNDIFSIPDAVNLSLCDASILRRGGVANSGLTLVALCGLLVERLLERS